MTDTLTLPRKRHTGLIALGATIAFLGLAVALALQPPDPTPSDPQATAQGVVQAVWGDYLNGRWGPAWDMLHPAQQALIPRDTFIERMSSEIGALPAGVNVEVVGTYREPITIPGTALSASSTAVTTELSDGGQSTSRRITTHAVQVGGAWRWVMSTDALDTLGGAS